jgi:type I restriction enzyme M protein
MQADGFSLDDKRSPIADNDIPDIIARFHSINSVGDGALDVPYNEDARERTDQSFLVPKDEIVQNDYDLSINKYKKTEYKPVEYAPTSQMLAELNDLETEITQGLKELEGMLNG